MLSEPASHSTSMQPAKDHSSSSSLDWSLSGALAALRACLPSPQIAFAPDVEARYAGYMEAGRIAHLRVTVGVGLVCYDLCGMLDHVILPDLLYLPALVRLTVATPVALALLRALSSLKPAPREVLVAALVMTAIAFQIGFLMASKDALVPYALMPVLVLSMYANVIVQLRARLAALTSIATLGGVFLAVHLRADLPSELQGALFLAISVCTALGLVSNHQLERAQRLGFLHVLRETERSELLTQEKAEFSKLSMIDALTGLANRRAFDTLIAELWQRGRSTGSSFSLLLIDVDHFKGFNDHYGHPAGDACLAHLARTIEDVVIRKQDMIARYGGEEFAVLLADCVADDARAIAELLREGVAAAAIPHEGRRDGQRFVTVSVGVADHDPTGGATIADVIAAADRHLYAAKRAGRNRVVVAEACETTTSSAGARQIPL